MEQKLCPNCGNPIPETAIICPVCHVKYVVLDENKSSGGCLSIGCGGLIVAAIIAYFVFDGGSENESTSKCNDSIEVNINNERMLKSNEHHNNQNVINGTKKQEASSYNMSDVDYNESNTSADDSILEFSESSGTPSFKLNNEDNDEILSSENIIDNETMDNNLSDSLSRKEIRQQKRNERQNKKIQRKQQKEKNN